MPIYRFSPYELDSTREELRKFGIRVKLERMPDGVFVDFDRGLTVAISKLRTALNDSSESPAYIETVAGEGYLPHFLSTQA